MSATATATQGARLLADVGDAQVFHCDWRALVDVVPECDALIVDAPYSEKTHKGHFSGTVENGHADPKWLARRGYDDKVARRRPLSYGAWSVGDVRSFVAAWAPRVRGWMVSITDDVLAHDWQGAMSEAGRYAFAPLPFLEEGKQPRLTGDGPAGWTVWIMVSRPKREPWSKWGSLPGGYTTRNKDQNRIPGGKSPWLMQRLVEDYSRPGDLVVDPCAGAGTTAIGVLRAGSGRRAIVGDALLAHAELAAQWVKHPHRPAPSAREERAPAGQASLFAGVSK